MCHSTQAKHWTSGTSEKELSATLRLISQGLFLQKCVPPPPSFPPLLGKQRQQISLLLCQSLRTTLGQPWDCPPEFPWTSLTFSFSAEGSGHCASTCFCGNWWNDGFVRHCPGNQEKRAWGWARRRWGSWGLGGGEGPLDLEGPLLRRGLEGT